MTTQTTNYGLTLFGPDDVPTWQGNWNEAMNKIDDVMHQIAEGGGGGSSVEVVQNTGDSLTSVMSQAAVTGELNRVNNSVSDKQNKLVFTGAGQNIKTVAGVSLEGEGDIEITPTISNRVYKSGIKTANANQTINLTPTNLPTTGSIALITIDFRPTVSSTSVYPLDFSEAVIGDSPISYTTTLAGGPGTEFTMAFLAIPFHPGRSYQVTFPVSANNIQLKAIII